MGVEKLNEKLIRTRQRCREREKVLRDFRHTSEMVQECRSDLLQTERTLERVEARMDALEGVSLANLLSWLAGDREKELEEGKERLLRAKMKHQERSEALEKLQEDLHNLRQRKEKLAGAKEEYRRLLTEKEQLIEEDSVTFADSQELVDTYLQLGEKEAELRADRKEIVEAIEAGAGARSVLDKMNSALRGAAGWGTLDIIGGGFLATAAKHSDLDKANEMARQAQRHLRRFTRELRDVSTNEGLEVDIGGFLAFADFFFDGLVSDWMVQSKINDSLQRTQQVLEEVETALAGLEEEKERKQEELEKLVRRKRDLLEKI